MDLARYLGEILLADSRPLISYHPVKLCHFYIQKRAAKTNPSLTRKPFIPIPSIQKGFC